MPKINKTELNAIAKTEPVKNLTKKSKATMETVVDTMQTKASKIDISTEELGFFLYNGKAYNVIFPR